MKFTNQVSLEFQSTWSLEGAIWRLEKSCIRNCIGVYFLIFSLEFSFRGFSVADNLEMYMDAGLCRRKIDTYMYTCMASFQMSN